MADHAESTGPLAVIMRSERAWVGPRPRTFRGQMVDGRVRCELAGRMGIQQPSPVECTSALAVAQWLALCGHYQRSIDWQRERCGGDVPLALPVTVDAELRAVRLAEQLRWQRRRAESVESNRRRRRRDAVRRLNQLRAAVAERGYGATAAELDACLEDWGER